MPHTKSAGATHTLCEPAPAQSTCTWLCHKSHMAQELTDKMPQVKTSDHTLCEPAQSQCAWTFRMQENLWVKCCSHTSCDPAQSKCTLTFHKSHIAREFTGKMPKAKSSTHTLCELRSRNALHFTSHIAQEFTDKMLQAMTSDHTLCEPAQSECAWTARMYENLHG